MAMHFRCGLVEGAGLSEAELRTVLLATGARSVTERLDGAFYDVWVDAGALRRAPSDPDVSDLLAALFDAPSPGVGWDEAAAAELCALVPGAESDAFRVARAVEGVPGLAFKDLDAALEALGAKLEKARAIKQGMMQELLTGRTRLVAAEAS